MIGVTSAGGFTIHPPWLQPPANAERRIVIDPGPAFGHGGHPTTAMVLDLLATQELRGLTVGDIGCGTGVLGIAAARLGAERVWAIDNDPAARQMTQANAVANGTPIDLVDAISACDLALVNVTIDVHEALAPSVQATRILVSGILEDQVDRLEAAYGRTLTTRRARDSWIAGALD